MTDAQTFAAAFLGGLAILLYALVRWERQLRRLEEQE